MSEGKVPFKVKGRIVKPLYKIRVGIDYAFLFTGRMHVGKKIDDQKEAATLMDVRPVTVGDDQKLYLGEPGQMIVGTVLRRVLDEELAAHAYVGRAFRFKLDKVPEKNYNALTHFDEIDIEGAIDPYKPAAEAPKVVTGGKK